MERAYECELSWEWLWLLKILEMSIRTVLITEGKSDS
jgi:hypothetical protein